MVLPSPKHHKTARNGNNDSRNEKILILDAFPGEFLRLNLPVNTCITNRLQILSNGSGFGLSRACFLYSSAPGERP